MKKLLVALTGILTIGAALPAVAGADWQLIEQANKVQAQANAANMQPEATQQPQLASVEGNPRSRIVLPLDHGPRAQTTPWSNLQRLLRAEREAHNRVES